MSEAVPAAATSGATKASVTIPARFVRPLKVGAGIAVTVAALAVVDTGFAMHAEHTLAQQVKAEAQLENTPQVYIGGMPYLGAAVLPDHEIPLMEVKALDIEVPRLGLVNASTTLRDVQVTADQLISGNFTGATVSTWSRAISVDAVSLGRLMGINDLQIANPKNISPTSGTSAEAILEGTLPGDTESTSVEVTLRLVDERFIMTPVNADNDRVAEAFSYSLDTRQLPLSAQATAVRLQGGSITFETQHRNTSLEVSQLSPVEIDGRYDSEGREN
ncbi:LmeA family phospholipid-binding protein [Corynebacterium ammoniagenes]|uniref:DUF2993 domain-containing protein n=2 Tax=Corynebacterium ammoniagenes TaxID=1697 RepID=A0AAV5G9Q3_CORAM|nr:DUF2993 domain-containing protein [Corynebacterium ammoniagenes]AQS74389.1 hypothetical protein CA40472_11190 [Corynebacterium ammoniagenes]EFG81243.1 hypothetical protein HMPREF0281_01415 [Corynebacterium ammoniagenes DSM 20306]NMF32240.1 DUF2993 domain-containing protein [Corynebacterium ammoniagenes]GJN43047.1 hypothetical protein CAT723_15260 [Corynebacterium ammoniagenes]